MAIVGGPPLGWMVTENIGKDGMLMRWRSEAALPKIGDQMVVQVELPVNHGFRPKCIHCQTVVAGISRREGSDPLLALSVSSMEFRDIQPPGKPGIDGSEMIPVTEWLA
ncbi:MAG TPA: hypothetical protein VFA33_27095 [Bryobacteraceae bacterium]|nr:hypothetical protein [Bryobacteraceae bacterium]